MQLDGETNMKYDSKRNPVEKCWKWKWQIGHRKVVDWAKESGKLAEGKWKIGRREVANQHMQLDRGKQIWNMIWREIQLKNAEHGSGKLAEGKWKIGRREVENWPKGEKGLHSRTQLTYARVITEKVGVHVLTIPIMCTFTHFLCIFLPQSTSKPQFPCFWHFVLPTHNTVSWGTWLVFVPQEHPQF